MKDNEILISILGGIGIYGVITNYNWVTIEEKVALIISSFFCIMAFILITIKEIKKKSKVSKSKTIS